MKTKLNCKKIVASLALPALALTLSLNLSNSARAEWTGTGGNSYNYADAANWRDGIVDDFISGTFFFNGNPNAQNNISTVTFALGGTTLSTGANSTAWQLAVGQTITGSGIVAGTKITAITGSNTFTIDTPTTAASSGNYSFPAFNNAIFVSIETRTLPGNFTYINADPAQMRFSPANNSVWTFTAANPVFTVDVGQPGVSRNFEFGDTNAGRVFTLDFTTASGGKGNPEFNISPSSGGGSRDTALIYATIVNAGNITKTGYGTLEFYRSVSADTLNVSGQAGSTVNVNGAANATTREAGVLDVREVNVIGNRRALNLGESSFTKVNRNVEEYNLYNGALTVFARDSAVTQTSLSDVNFYGRAALGNTNNSVTSSTLTVSTLTRHNFATLNLLGDSLGINRFIKIADAASSQYYVDALRGGDGANGTNLAIIPWLTQAGASGAINGASDSGAWRGTDFVTYTAEGGFRMLTAANYKTFTTASALSNTDFAADDNVAFIPTVNNSTWTFTGNVTLNALKIGSASLNNTLSLGAGQRLTLSSGALAILANTTTISGNTGILDTGTNPLIVTGRANLTINSVLTNSITDPDTPGLIVANVDTVVTLAGAQKTYGGVTLVQTTLAAGAANVLPYTTEVRLDRDAVFRMGNVNTRIAKLSGNGFVQLEGGSAGLRIGAPGAALPTRTIEVTSGGVIAPGDLSGDYQAGTLIIGGRSTANYDVSSVVFKDGSIFAVDLSATANDMLLLSNASLVSTLTLSGGTVELNFLGGYTPAEGAAWMLTSGFDLATADFAKFTYSDQLHPDWEYKLDLFDDNLRLTLVSTIPEPATWALLLSGAALWLSKVAGASRSGSGARRSRYLALSHSGEKFTYPRKFLKIIVVFFFFCVSKRIGTKLMNTKLNWKKIVTSLALPALALNLSLNFGGVAYAQWTGTGGNSYNYADAANWKDGVVNDIISGTFNFNGNSGQTFALTFSISDTMLSTGANASAWQLAVGQSITGNGIPAGAKITAITGSNTFTIDTPTTDASSGNYSFAAFNNAFYITIASRTLPGNFIYNNADPAQTILSPANGSVWNFTAANPLISVNIGQLGVTREFRFGDANRDFTLDFTTSDGGKGSPTFAVSPDFGSGADTLYLYGTIINAKDITKTGFGFMYAFRSITADTFNVSGPAGTQSRVDIYGGQFATDRNYGELHVQQANVVGIRHILNISVGVDDVSGTRTFTADEVNLYNGALGVNSRDNKPTVLTLDTVNVYGRSAFGNTSQALVSVSGSNVSGATLTVDKLVRHNFATINLLGDNLGITSGTTGRFIKITDAANSQSYVDALRGGDGANGTNVAIIPWLTTQGLSGNIGAADSGVWRGSDFVTYTAAGGFRTLTASEYKTFTTNGATFTSADFNDDDNVSLNASAASTWRFTGDQTMNSLRLGTGGKQTLELSANQRLTIASGAVAILGNELAINGNTGILDTGTNPLITTGRSSITINSVLTNSITDPDTPGLIVANIDTWLILAGAQKTYGGMTLVQSNLRLDAANLLPFATQVRVDRDGHFVPQAATRVGQLTGSGYVGLSANGSLRVGGTGATLGNRTIEIASGGVLAPGDLSGEYQTGTLFIGRNDAGTDVSYLTFQPGSIFAVDISATANDLIQSRNASLVSTLRLNGGTVELNFLGGYTPAEGDSWQLTSGFDLAFADFEKFTYSDLAHPDWEYLLDFDSADNLRLTLVSTIPEPATWALLLGGAALLLTLRRRRPA